MTNFDFSDATPEQVASVAPRARRDGIPVEARPSTRWFAVTRDDGLVVVSIGLHSTDRRKARIKGVWCDPDHRGVGLGELATVEAIVEARLAGAFTIEAYALDSRWYLAHGFRDRGPFKSATKVELSPGSLVGGRRPWPRPAGVDVVDRALLAERATLACSPLADWPLDRSTP